MADLIDRQSVIDLLKKSASRDIEEVVITEKHIKLIKDMPVAYSVEKVISNIDKTLIEFGGGNDCARCAFREICDDGNDGCIETMAEVFRNTVRMGGVL